MLHKYTCLPIILLLNSLCFSVSIHAVTQPGYNLPDLRINPALISTSIEGLKTINTSSSKYRKTDITEPNNSPSNIMKLNGIAEELKKTNPEIAHNQPNQTHENTIAYGKITAVLVDILKEQHAQILDLKKQLLTQQKAEIKVNNALKTKQTEFYKLEERLEDLESLFSILYNQKNQSLSFAKKQ